MHRLRFPIAALSLAGPPLLLFLVLTVYDVIIGGAIAALLQSDGFTAVDQRINNIHQLAYGLVVGGVLAWFYARVQNVLPVLAVIMLFAGLVEDTMFYLLVPFLNPLIGVITGGAKYRVAGGAWLPDQISGWPGWVGRMAVGENVAFSRGEVLAANAIAGVLAAFLLLRYARMR